MLSEPIAVTLYVTDILENLNIPYVIGGSMAGAVHGVMRATMDVDLVADLGIEHAAPLVEALGNAFYADIDTISQAIRQQTSFNILHLDTMFKVDIFVTKSRLFDRSQLGRRQLQQLSLEPERYAYVASAEDVILAKLEWYRMGGEVSDRQWQDVLGVFKAQSDQLDMSYLHRMADQLGIDDLLEKILTL